MGQKNPKAKLVVNYYIFQKRIEQNLTNWKNQNDGNSLQKGYLIHPDWMKKLKNNLKYEKLKKSLDNIPYSNFTEEQVHQLVKLIELDVKDIDINAMSLSGDNDFSNFSEKYISLEILKNFINGQSFKNLKNIYKKDIKTIKMEEIKYIFKQKMLILFFENNKIIKVILYNENKNKIINLI